MTNFKKHTITEFIVEEMKMNGDVLFRSNINEIAEMFDVKQSEIMKIVKQLKRKHVVHESELGWILNNIN